MGLYRDKRACPKNLSPLEHNIGIEGLATGLAGQKSEKFVDVI